MMSQEAVDTKALLDILTGAEQPNPVELAAYLALMLPELPRLIAELPPGKDVGTEAELAAALMVTIQGLPELVSEIPAAGLASGLTPELTQRLALLQVTG